MPRYIFRCLGCDRLVEQTSRTPIGCPDCGSLLRRDFRSESVSFRPILHGHFNHTVGGYVSGMKDFRSELSRKADETHARTGIESDFQPVDVRDVPKDPNWEYPQPTGTKVIY